MRGGQIADMDIIAHPGAVGRRIIGAINSDTPALAQRRLDRDLDEVRGTNGRLPAALLRIGARHVEIAQGGIVDRMRRRDVAQHRLGHQL